MKDLTDKKTFFAPELYIKSGVKDISFYVNAFGAVELRRFMNDDGSYHVSEMSIDGAMFHIHEESPRTGGFDPTKHEGVTANIGLFVDDVDAVMNRAITAGAEVISPAQDYDYGYRQGMVKDPFGHHWMLEKKI